MTAMIRIRSLTARGLAGSILLAAFPPTAALRAQDVPDASAAPRYEVELIVFRNLDQRGTTPEVEPAPAAGDTEPAAIPEAVAATADSIVTLPVDDAIAPLAPQSLRLGGIAAKLGRGGAYQLLYHGGWVQAVMRQNQARPTPLPAEAAMPGQINGAIKLYRERFLHVLVDVTLQGGDLVAEQHIRQGRRLRGQAVHYFDHPQFGVILAVRPVNDGAAAELSGKSTDP